MEYLFFFLGFLLLYVGLGSHLLLERIVLLSAAGISGGMAVLYTLGLA